MTSLRYAIFYYVKEKVLVVILKLILLQVVLINFVSSLIFDVLIYGELCIVYHIKKVPSDVTFCVPPQLSQNPFFSLRPSVDEVVPQ